MDPLGGRTDAVAQQGSLDGTDHQVLHQVQALRVGQGAVFQPAGQLVDQVGDGVASGFEFGAIKAGLRGNQLQ
ncbi:hypothetical protein D9M73_259540 [compost metagenome]